MVKGKVSAVTQSISGNVSSPCSTKGSVNRAEIVVMKELEYNTRFEFPSIGKAGLLYIATDENKMYYFDEEKLIYHCIGSDYHEIEEIIGIL